MSIYLATNLILRQNILELVNSEEFKRKKWRFASRQKESVFIPHLLLEGRFQVVCHKINQLLE